MPSSPSSSIPRRFPLGKLPNETLAELLAKIPASDPRVVVGPGIGLDAAVLEMADRYLVAKTDPITFATDLVGWYAVNVNANDVATTGATPRWFLATLLMPENQADEALARKVFEQITDACAGLEVSLVGGHSEITSGIDRPIVVGCMLGEVEPDRLVTPAGVQDGDVVLLTAGIPIEATAIIAREKAQELSGTFDEEFLSRSENYLFEPGISVVGAAKIAMTAGEVHAMHDPTEGGLAAGLWELAQASQTSLEVQEETIPVVSEGRVLCEHYGLDPLSSIASGALLLSSAEESANAIAISLADAGISCTAIGTVVGDAQAAVHLLTPSGLRELTLPTRDEIAKLFE